MFRPAAAAAAAATVLLMCCVSSADTGEHLVPRAVMPLGFSAVSCSAAFDHIGPPLLQARPHALAPLRSRVAARPRRPSPGPSPAPARTPAAAWLW